MAALLFTNLMTYVVLLSKNEEWKKSLMEDHKNEVDVSLIADALAEHVYYDGDSIPCNQVVRHYSRSSKMYERKELSEVLHGEKIVLLLSSNCCSSCASDEIERIKDLAREIGYEHLVVAADFPLHAYRPWAILLRNEGYYEIDTEHLGLNGSPTRETPVIMLVKDGRVKTSFVVGQQTSAFADWFHEYLSDYFKGKK